jgi:hypothetical protein
MPIISGRRTNSLSGRRKTTGLGDGVLAAALRKELDEAFALSCNYSVGTPGVTRVTIK